MGVNRWICIGILILLPLTGCAVVKTESPARIALLAPFEGRYREIGYSALYPARLAFMDVTHVALLAVDDGGSVQTAIDRARALTRDPLVKGVIVLGHNATDPTVQAVFDDLPVLVVGYWHHPPQQANVFMFTSANIPSMLGEWREITEDPMPLGGDAYALQSFAQLHPNLDGVQVVSSGTPPDTDFIARVQASDQFAAAPGLLGTTVYDAASLLIDLIDNPAMPRTHVLQAINATGVFVDGYWQNAPVHIYEYINGVLRESN
ncbi:MAG: hypothetical protein CUN56_09970 [Phototrophicales bacterium]|nr:MAG: hypothetical protein CUN56_09970 [Phototrophicales bacterium]